MKMASNFKRQSGLLSILVWSFATLPQTGVIAVTVTNTKDNAPKAALISGSLRWAIAKTDANGTVDFAPVLAGKTIVLLGGQLLVDKGLHVKGPGCAGLTVSGNDRGRVFFVTGSGGGPGGVTISGMTITKGKAGGSEESGGDPAQQKNGGGIYNAGDLRLERVCVTGNWAPEGSGGGIYNRGTLGGVVESTISQNSAGMHGGGICNEQDMGIRASAIINNVAGGDGGGIQDGGTSNVINSTIAQNRARGAGGGMNDAGGATVKAYNVTVAGNVAGSGGGTALLFGTWDFQNSIIANNTAPAAPDVRNVGDPGSPGALAVQISVGNNLIGKTEGAGPGSFIAGDKVDLVSKLGPLQDNGGPTPTMALLPGSAAIDSGDNRWIAPPVLEPALAADQRGFTARVINGGNGQTVDMGACEYATAKVLQSQAAGFLAPCRASADLVSARYATRAIRSNEIGSDARLWLGETLLADCGELLFAFQREAVSSMEKVFKSGKDINCTKAAKDALSCMLLADEQIVRATIDTAMANSGSGELMAAAGEQLVKARAALGAQRYAQAIDHYEQGWRCARKAQGIQSNAASEAACRELRTQLEKDDFDRWGNGDRGGGADAKAPVLGGKKKSSRRPSK